MRSDLKNYQNLIGKQVSSKVIDGMILLRTKV